MRDLFDFIIDETLCVKLLSGNLLNHMISQKLSALPYIAGIQTSDNKKGRAKLMTLSSFFKLRLIMKHIAGLVFI